MMWRIGKMLGLKTKTRAERIGDSALSDHVTLQMIPRIELDGRLRRQQLEHTTGGRMHHPGCRCKFTIRAVQDVVMVVAKPQLQLFVVGIDPLADPGRAREIE